MSFASFPLGKCHVGGGLVHSILPAAVIFVVVIRNVLMVSKVKDAGPQKTYHTSHRRAEQKLLSGEFSTPVSQSVSLDTYTHTHTVYILHITLTDGQEESQPRPST